MDRDRQRPESAATGDGAGRRTGERSRHETVACLGGARASFGSIGLRGTAQRVVTGPTVCARDGAMLASATPCPIHGRGAAAPAPAPRCPIHGTLLAPALASTGRCPIHGRGGPTVVASRATIPATALPGTASLPPMRAVRYLTMSDEPWDFTLPDPLGVRTPGPDSWQAASGTATRAGDGGTAPGSPVTTAIPPRRDWVVPASAEVVVPPPGGPLLDVRGTGPIALEYEPDPSPAGRPRATSSAAPEGRVERRTGWVSESRLPGPGPGGPAGLAARPGAAAAPARPDRDAALEPTPGRARRRHRLSRGRSGPRRGGGEARRSSRARPPRRTVGASPRGARPPRGGAR